MVTSPLKLFLFGSAVVVCSCATTKDTPRYEIGDRDYLFREKGKRWMKTYVSVEQDSLTIYDNKTGSRIAPSYGQKQIFIGPSFDIDIMTVLCKYHPAAGTVPRQLNSNFNGSVFVGYRFDRFSLSFRSTPAGLKKKHAHRAFSVGGFGGIGSTSIGPWTTNNLMTDEYNGLVLTRGLAIMGGIKRLTVGVGVGWDYLTDRDQDIWVYQNKAWYGVTLGLNLN